MMFTRYIFALMVAVSFASVGNAAEDESPDWNTTTLTGDWGGARSSLYNKGVSMEFTHKSDVLSDTSGGIKRGTAWLGHTEARIKMNLEKLWGWGTTTAYIHYHSQLGSKFNTNYVGSFVGVDNIEAGANTAQFYHAWIQKSFSDDRLSVLAGLYPIDSEFYVTDTSGVFIQPPYGMANDMAQSGQNGPPIFPIGALAVRVKYTSPGKNFYLQGALTDGVPGDPNNPHGTHIQLNKGDGTLSIVEFGYTPQGGEPPFEVAKPGELVEPEQKIHEEHESFNKTAIGFWRYSSRFDDLIDVDALGNPLRRVSQGVYFLAERTLFVEKDHPAQGLSGFVRFGTASRDIHQADWTGSLGLRYHGLISGRDDDIAGIAVTINHASDKYQRLTPSLSRETDVEATYRAQIKPWLALQPALQYILNPNMDPIQKNAWVVGMRLEVAF
ncbi:MAG: carbohydrate porin [Gallionella sp.]|nr:carbohydrate porin [Gallionella sp.]